MAPSVMLALTLAYLLISCACGQRNKDAEVGCTVTQLTVNGCRIFVRNFAGTNDFVIEPLMCITQSLSNVLPQHDILIQKVFLSVPVTLTDNDMLQEIQKQLQHLSPNSVRFASVSDIRVSMDVSSGLLKTVWFLRNPDEPVGYLRLGCNRDSQRCYDFLTKVRASNFEAFNWITVTAEVELGSINTELKYKLMMKNQNFLHHEFYASKFDCMSKCDNLQFLQSVMHSKCTARVHQQQDVNDQFYIEPLLCHNTKSLANEPIISDNIRDMYYLKLDVVLQDDAVLNAVKSKLGQLSSDVRFMQIRQVKIEVPSFLSSRFEIAPLMVSGDWKSSQLRVYCKTEEDCKLFKSEIIANPLSFWSHVKFEVTSQIPSQCIVKSELFFYNVEAKKASSNGLINVDSWTRDLVKNLELSNRTKSVDSRKFVIVQQRMTNSVSFARSWNEYEAGFGDAADFWIGLSTIHLLSNHGVTLRVEMKLMNDGTELHQEYEKFKVEDATTKYRMTCGGIIDSRSNNRFDGMSYHSGMQFSTMDSDNDRNIDGSCSTDSTEGGNGGWWFRNCAHCHPNHVYGHKDMWGLFSIGYQPLSEIRLMLEI